MARSFQNLYTPRDTEAGNNKGGKWGLGEQQEGRITLFFRFVLVVIRNEEIRLIDGLRAL